MEGKNGHNYTFLFRPMLVGGVRVSTAEPPQVSTIMNDCGFAAFGVYGHLSCDNQSLCG